MKLIATLAAVLLLAGCGGNSAASEEDLRDNLRPVTVALKDGSYVQCVVFQSIQEGGIWCKDTNTPDRKNIQPYPAENAK